MKRTESRNTPSPAAAALAAVLLMVTAFTYALAQLFLPFPSEFRDREVEIRRGTSTRHVFRTLEEKGLVRDANLMVLLAKVTGAEGRIKAGYYSFSSSTSPFDVYMTVLRGRVVENTVTIIEGDTVWNVAQRLEEAGIMDRKTFFRLNSDRAFLDSLAIDAPSLEGYLFPDTYRFPKGFAPRKVLEVMVDNMRSKFTPGMYSQMKKMGFNERQVLTMASIIEKEAVVDSERAIISAVYHNRLRKRMRLEADPTAIYGIKDFSEGVTRKDLRRRTPYNTYRRRGLPPGPIAAPGLKSIIAALYPADVPYLYFVSKNNGEHHFSTTTREHFNAVNFYRSEKRRLRKTRDNDRT